VVGTHFVPPSVVLDSYCENWSLTVAVFILLARRPGKRHGLSIGGPVYEDVLMVGFVLEEPAQWPS
jgi:hypothetical protein